MSTGLGNAEVQVSLEELMRRYQAADREAGIALVERVGPNLVRFFLAYRVQRSEADDLVQETWLRVHRVRRTYRPEAPVLPWIFAIARHVRLDALRKRYRTERREVSGETLPEVPVMPEVSDFGGVSFEEMIDGLPESQQEVLTLLKVNGLSLEEVAGVTDSTVGAVKQKASRAYAKLRSVLPGLMWGKQDAL